ncbi:MAG: gamma-glutamyltransferase [Xanthomonadaceae bacterium]|nr:gamma-glutamyltransferase [Xanthomonadaceae bacterium]
MRNLLVALLLVITTAAAADAPRRPPEAAIASAHPLATAAGHAVLNAGGNAFDAAVAVSAALSVVEPYSSGLGGGGFFLLHRAADGHEVFVDARERAPFAATHDMFVDEHGEPDTARMREGALAAGIPGLPAGLVHLATRYGELPLATSMAPAIRLAREGFEVDRRFALLTERTAPLLQRHGTTAFFIDGRPPQAGERLRQSDLAVTLEAVAADGARSFYRGEIAARLVDGVREAGGIWTLDDLARYEVVERRPLIGHYRGHRIVTAPPPSSGGIVLLATLNILSGFDWDALDGAARVHLLAESWRRTYRDRGQYVGDPAFVEVPVAQLTAPAHARVLRGTIDMARATPSASLPPVTTRTESTSTTHFSIIDVDGNRVAATQTVNFRYGAGLMPAGTGVVLNNEMFDFVARAGTPDGFELVSAEANLVAPGKRPVSSMTPTFIDGPRGVAILGTPGGSRIITMVTLAALDWIGGTAPAGIVGRARIHHQYMPDVISYEPGAISDELAAALTARGHTLRDTGRRYGNMNAVTWEFEDNAVNAATDPRNEALVDF